MEALRAGARLFLDACAEPEVERIILLDAPSVLGWEAWRDLAARYGPGLVQLGLQSAMDAGAVGRQPAAPPPPPPLRAPAERAPHIPPPRGPPAARGHGAPRVDRILGSITPGA